MKKIELSDNFTYGNIILYSLPAVVSLLVTTSFGLVDGYFVSNLLGIKQFAAVNLVFPVLIVLPAAGYTIGSGGGAVISEAMGKGDKIRAHEIFTMSTALILAAGTILGIIGIFILPFLINLLGADKELYGYCLAYGQIMALFLPAFMINTAFELLWITAEKSWIGFAVAAINGASNAFLDWLFMGVLNMGIMGAGLATAIANLIAALFTVLYFLLPNKSCLRFRRFNSDILREIPGILFNGASEMLDAAAGSVSAIVMNARALAFFGETGVDALGVFDFVFGLFAAFFFGISSTSITVIGYKHGQKEFDEIKAILKRGIILMICSGIIMFILCELLAEPLAGIFVGYDVTAHALTIHVIRIQAATFVLFGFNTFVSSVFTGLEDGLSSILISASQTLVAPIVFVFLLPLFLGGNGIWYTIVAESIVTAFLTVMLLLTRFKKAGMT